MRQFPASWPNRGLSGQIFICLVGNRAAWPKAACPPEGVPATSAARPRLPDSPRRYDDRMSECDSDVLIVGSGPAGLATAIAARREGLSALVLDKGGLVDGIYGFPGTWCSSRRRSCSKSAGCRS